MLSSRRTSKKRRRKSSVGRGKKRRWTRKARKMKSRNSSDSDTRAIAVRASGRRRLKCDD